MDNNQKTLVRAFFWGNGDAGIFPSLILREKDTMRQSLVFTCDAFVDVEKVNPAILDRLSAMKRGESGHIEIGYRSLSDDGTLEVSATGIRKAGDGHKVAQFWFAWKNPSRIKLQFRLIVWGNPSLINGENLTPGEQVVLELKEMRLQDQAFWGELLDIKRRDVKPVLTSVDTGEVGSNIEEPFSFSALIDQLDEGVEARIDRRMMVEPVFEVEDIGAEICTEIEDDDTIENMGAEVCTEIRDEDTTRYPISVSEILFPPQDQAA